MKYFTIEELTRSETARRLNIDNTPPMREKAKLSVLVNNILDPLREAWGKPITVNSGYRCPQLNKAVGGVATSQHLKGEAADITTGNKVDNARLFQLVQDLGLPYDQLIDEHDFAWIHVSHSLHNRHQILKL